MPDSVRKVYDSLFVSGYQAARVKAEKFDRVVSLAAPSKHTDAEFIITDGDHEYVDFESAVDKIIQYLGDENTVLVNCQAGLSRSVSACIAAQVCYYNVPYVEALQNARFGHRMPEPELLRSAERYISENYSYNENRRMNEYSKKRLESFCQTVINSMSSDDSIEDLDRVKMHMKNSLSLELDEIEKLN